MNTISSYLEALLVSWASVSTCVFLSINCGDSCLPISSTEALSVHTAQVTTISTHWCYLMEIDFAIRHLQSKSWTWTEICNWKQQTSFVVWYISHIVTFLSIIWLPPTSSRHSNWNHVSQLRAKRSYKQVQYILNLLTSSKLKLTSSILHPNTSTQLHTFSLYTLMFISSNFICGMVNEHSTIDLPLSVHLVHQVQCHHHGKWLANAIDNYCYMGIVKISQCWLLDYLTTARKTIFIFLTTVKPD